MIWTKRRPSGPGWYWIRLDGIHEIVQLVESEIPKPGLYALLPPKAPWGESETISLEQMTVEWYGPIQIPT
jgi:hypothetical protein